jgi:hypothetical protein
MQEKTCHVTQDDAMEFVADFLAHTKEGKRQLWEIRWKALSVALVIVLAHFIYFKSYAWASALILFTLILIYQLKFTYLRRHKSEYAKPHHANRFGLVKYSIEKEGITKENGGIRMSFAWKTLKNNRKNGNPKAFGKN